jgi:hypothetical protein
VAGRLDTMTTIPMSSLRDRLTTLSVYRMVEVEEALRFALGLSMSGRLKRTSTYDTGGEGGIRTLEGVQHPLPA